MINYAVYCQKKQRAILQWRITSISPSLSFRNFFETVVKSQICDRENLLTGVFVGKSKDSLDSVDYDLNIDEVIPVFGPFVKYAVDQIEKVRFYYSSSSCACMPSPSYQAKPASSMC